MQKRNRLRFGNFHIDRSNKKRKTTAQVHHKDTEMTFGSEIEIESQDTRVNVWTYRPKRSSQALENQVII